MNRERIKNFTYYGNAGVGELSWCQTIFFTHNTHTTKIIKPKTRNAESHTEAEQPQKFHWGLLFLHKSARPLSRCFQKKERDLCIKIREAHSLAKINPPISIVDVVVRSILSEKLLLLQLIALGRSVPPSASSSPPPYSVCVWRGSSESAVTTSHYISWALEPSLCQIVFCVEFIVIAKRPPPIFIPL